MSIKQTNLKYRTPSIAIILDDERLIAECFALLVRSWDYFQSVHTFDDEHDMLPFMANLSDTTPVILYTDYYLANKTIIPLIGEIRRHCKPAKIIVVSSISNPALISHLLSYRIDGLLSKSSTQAEFRESTHSVSSGKRYIDSKIAHLLETENNKQTTLRFTSREIEILHYTSLGLTVDDTAKRIHLSRHTIAAHRRKMMVKAGCSNVVELLAYARKIELI